MNIIYIVLMLVFIGIVIYTGFVWQPHEVHETPNFRVGANRPLRERINALLHIRFSSPEFGAILISVLHEIEERLRKLERDK